MDTTRQRPQVPPRHHITNPATTHSSDITPPIPKPRTHISPQRDTSPKPIVTTGVRVLPPLPSSSTNPSPPQLPSYTGVPVPVTSTPVLPSYEAAISSQPPPPKPQDTPLVAEPGRYILPDPTSSLSPEELKTVSRITSMGFPQPRVARAVKKFSEDKVRNVTA